MRFVWDEDTKRLYETGVRRGVLYPRNSEGIYPTGVVWNGLTSVAENPTGGEENALYADDIKYLSLTSREDWEGTIEAYMYPDEFAECDGSAEIETGVFIGQQVRKPFGMCYRTVLGNDTEFEDYGYKLHLLYGLKASPSDKTYETEDDDPDAVNFSWDVKSTPVAVTGYKPTSQIVINSRKVNAAKLKALEDILYGVDTPEFSASKTYAVGDYVTHNDLIYKCKTAITTAASWDSTKWDEIVDTTVVTISEFSTSKTYAVGDYVTYSGDTYRCKTAVSSAGAWDSAKWDEVTPEALGPRLPLPDEVKTLMAA